MAKEQGLLHHFGMLAVFSLVSAGNILLMVGWGTKCHSVMTASSAVTDLCRLIEIFRFMELQWQFCGKAVDIYESMVSAIQVGMPEAAHGEQRGNKTGLFSPRQDTHWGCSRWLSARVLP